MSFNPRGRACERAIFRHTETLDTGEEITLTLSGPGTIYRVRGESTVPGQKPADMRRDFVRTARNLGCVVEPCEYAYATHDQRGKAVSEPVPSAYRAVGPKAGLDALATHHAVVERHAAMAVRVPVIAQGSGPEKVRPPMGSAYGKPAQVAATAAALAKGRSDRMRAAVQAGQM